MPGFLPLFRAFICRRSHLLSFSLNVFPRLLQQTNGGSSVTPLASCIASSIPRRVVTSSLFWQKNRICLQIHPQPMAEPGCRIVHCPPRIDGTALGDRSVSPLSVSGVVTVVFHFFISFKVFSFSFLSGVSRQAVSRASHRPDTGIHHAYAPLTCASPNEPGFVRWGEGVPLASLPCPRRDGSGGGMGTGSFGLLDNTDRASGLKGGRGRLEKLS
ncbi:hypothetical protein B0T22DRAFT_208342 [Podospora appendiculata]|uniref:Uncharacterized protein n=1 Tax=Podospora appendiculata TaxID=314037 RepID=A0AAE0X4D7_9PEZI|nr:hypothetical protein B0T22DRAFT_208342 [Podospora appendiculata]